MILPSTNKSPRVASWPRYLIVLGVGFAAIPPSCKGSDPEPQVSSETNFLKHCASSCDGGLVCLCGVCTRACTGADECTALAEDARCVAVPEQRAQSVNGSCHQGATCDASCISNQDCAPLGSGYRCELGACRSGNATCPTTALPPGDQTREIIVGGMTRRFTFHVPASYSGSSPVPLVLDFHPMELGSSWEQANSGYKALSDAEGFIVAWPEGLSLTWDIGPCCSTAPVDELGFVRAVVRQLSIESCVDARRVYAVGFSMGGGMAYYLACKQAELFAGIAPSSMDLPIDSQLACQPSRPVSVISFRGSADDVVPYNGGITVPPGHPELSMDVLGAAGTFTKWANLNGCSGAPSSPDANGCSTYASCKDGTEVTLCTVEGGIQVIGDARVAWQTLKRHAMP